MTVDSAIERLSDLNPGTTPVEEGSPHERPHKPLLLLAALDLIDEGKASPLGREFAHGQQSSQPVDEASQGFSPHLTWSHYRALMRVDNVEARDFYDQEAFAL